MSKYAIVECDNCSAARRGYSYPELWRKLKAEGWKDAKDCILCPVCVRIRDKRQEEKSDGQEKEN